MSSSVDKYFTSSLGEASLIDSRPRLLINTELFKLVGELLLCSRSSSPLIEYSLPTIDCESIEDIPFSFLPESASYD